MSGTMRPLKLDAYTDPEFRKKARQPNTFSLQINPETYRHQHATAYVPESAADTAGAPSKFKIMQPQTVSFEFYLDATGVIPGVRKLSETIDELKSVVYAYNGDIHAPNYLLLTWAGFVFKCRLTSMDIEYTLFKPVGTPLRARVSVSFQEYLSPNEIAKRSAKNSPDLTHLRVVEAGDTLPLMCERIYGDSRFYLRVAQHNALQDFRSLVPGTRLMFPPLAATL